MANINGTAGDDLLSGTSGMDNFRLEEGGSDTAFGGGRDDVFHMGAEFDATDRLDGEGGTDRIFLSGGYWAGLTITAEMAASIEGLGLGEGRYNLVLEDGVMDNDVQFRVTGGQARQMKFDASQETGADIYIYGGEGNDVLRTGAGDDFHIVNNGGRDKIFCGAGDDSVAALAAWEPKSRFVGGEGVDSIVFEGEPGRKVVLGGAVVGGFEAIDFRDFTADLRIETSDSLIKAGGTLFISTTLIGGDPTARLIFDGAEETDGRMQISGTQNDDRIEGGGGADTLSGFDGSDTLIGGGGGDLYFTNGNANRIVYRQVADSLPDDPDVIGTLDGDQIIDLRAIDARTDIAGNQAFRVVTAFTGSSGELTVERDQITREITISMDVNGDGIADMVIEGYGDEDFTGFVL